MRVILKRWPRRIRNILHRNLPDMYSNSKSLALEMQEAKVGIYQDQDNNMIYLLMDQLKVLDSKIRYYNKKKWNTDKLFQQKIETKIELAKYISK